MEEEAEAKGECWPGRAHGAGCEAPRSQTLRTAAAAVGLLWADKRHQRMSCPARSPPGLRTAAETSRLRESPGRQRALSQAPAENRQTQPQYLF